MKLFTPKQTKEAERSVLDELLRKENAAAIALKAKETQLNQLETEFPLRLEEKRKELTQIERRLQLAREKEQNEVFVLEERRKAALRPITEEQQALEKTKEGIQEMLLRLDTERACIKKERKEVDERSSELALSAQNIERTHREMSAMLEQRRKELDETIANAGVTLSELHDEEARIAILRSEVAEKFAGLEEAEHIAKGAMANADRQIARAQEERRKAIEERRSLAAAIKEAKRRGLWQKMQ